MIALIDYGIGNLSSVRKAFAAAGADDLRLVTSPSELENADKIILPGVGNFGDGIRNLRSTGFDKVLLRRIGYGIPLFGICLGFQLLFDSSEEAPGENGLGLVRGRVLRFSSDLKLKVPQIGWNSIRKLNDCRQLEGLKDGDYFYFVHSYYVLPEDKSAAACSTEYGIEFCSCIVKDNITAVQFHPEKSQDKGLCLIRNFLKS